MYIVANRVPVNPGWETQFEERFRQRAGQVERQPGFVRMQVLRPVSEGTPYVVLTVWESAEAFQAWVDSDDFQRAHANPLPKEAYRSGGAMERFEVVVAAEKGDSSV